MKTFFASLALVAATFIPAQASIHDFSPENSRPTPTRTKAQVGQGECITTRDRSKVCYVRSSRTNYSISILDVDYPGQPEVAYIDCSTGRWGAIGDIPKATLELYLDDFCTNFG